VNRRLAPSCCASLLYVIGRLIIVFFKQVKTFDEVMIKNEPIDDASSDSSCILPEATVKHETEDPIAI